MFLTETEHEIVSYALDIIRDRSCWTQDAIARDQRGVSVFSYEPTAVAWCAEGAIQRAMGFSELSRRNDMARYDEILAKLSDVGCQMYPERGLRLVHHLNDDLGHDEIVAIFEKALVKLGSDDVPD